jgi:hypothetical protein
MEVKINMNDGCECEKEMSLEIAEFIEHTFVNNSDKSIEIYGVYFYTNNKDDGLCMRQYKLYVMPNATAVFNFKYNIVGYIFI